MSKLILIFGLLFMINTNAQQNFEKYWKTVEAFELEGKTKSANEMVDKYL